jgi:hypothetical protein
MNKKTEDIITTLSVFFVLFSAMWKPLVSVVISVIALVCYVVYKITQKK